MWPGFIDELEKIASSRLARFIRTAPRKDLASSIEHIIGAAHPTPYKSKELNDVLMALRSGKDVSRDSAVKAIRSRLSVKGPRRDYFAPSTKERLEAAKSFPERIKSELVTVQHGGVEPELKSILKYGPKATIRPTIGASGKSESAGLFFHKPSDPLASRVPSYAKSRSEYAGGAPAVLSVDVPRKLLEEKGRIGGGEWTLPRSLWKHVQNPRIEVLKG